MGEWMEESCVCAGVDGTQLMMMMIMVWMADADDTAAD